MNNVNYIIGSEQIANRPFRPFTDLLCNFVIQFSERLLNDNVAKRFPDIVALAFWTRKGNIERLREQYKTYTDRLGRGLVFHIAPSNIPVNFAFSYFFSLLAGNTNIVRLPSKPFPQIKIICDAILKTLTTFPEIEESTAFVSYPANDEITASFCNLADVRIIWGGDKTVETIRSLKTKPRCVDIVFPDRYSFCIIAGQVVLSASEVDLKRLAELFYNDTYLMDQNACSSPQFIFWQQADDNVKDKFWNAVADLAHRKYDLQPMIAVNKYIHFCKDAIEYSSLKTIRRDDNILYRALFSSLPDGDLTHLRGAGGYFYEYDIQNLEELIPFINEKYQTVTYYGINPEEIKEIILNHRIRGIDRIVPIGSAMDIGLVWDGYELINILSRTISNS